MTPPLEPGVWQVRIGDSDDVWYDVPGRLVVVDTVRVFLIEAEKNVVELIYAAVGMHEHDLEDDLVQAEALVEGYPNIPLMRKGDGDWYVMFEREARECQMYHSLNCINHSYGKKVTDIL